MVNELDKPEFESEHHKPRKIDKKKKHGRGFSEERQANRQSRITFKRYVQELEEDLLDDEIDESIL